MRQLYTSPRQENIDRVVSLLSEHGIETTVQNRSNWNRPSYERFSYAQPQDNQRDGWAQVWVTKADDYAQARSLLRGIGIEPLVRNAEELAATRDPSPARRRGDAATRVRRIVLVALLAVFALLMMRYLHVI